MTNDNLIRIINTDTQEEIAQYRATTVPRVGEVVRVDAYESIAFGPEKKKWTARFLVTKVSHRVMTGEASRVGGRLIHIKIMGQLLNTPE